MTVTSQSTRSPACRARWCSIQAARRQGSACTIKLLSNKGKEVTFANTEIPAVYTLPRRARQSRGRRTRSLGDVIARIPQESSKTRDITGGLPRVGRPVRGAQAQDRRFWRRIRHVSFGKETKGKRRLIITSDTARSTRS